MCGWYHLMRFCLRSEAVHWKEFTATIKCLFTNGWVTGVASIPSSGL